jgi:hypoxanthine-DNA glycosylase
LLKKIKPGKPARSEAAGSANQQNSELQPVPGGDAASPLKASFAPVVDARVRLLLLGSLPGERSLSQQQYYAHPQNRFWHLMGEVLEQDLPAMPYPERLACLLAHRVGLWDVVARARRAGSLDSNIRQRSDNDLPALLAQLPKLQAIGFNGNTAARIGLQVLGTQADDYRIFCLPSSSPAYTLGYAAKSAAWHGLRAVLAG